MIDDSYDCPANRHNDCHEAHYFGGIHLYSLPPLQMEDKVKLTLQNCEMLRQAFNTIQSVIAERNKNSGVAFCDAHTLAAAGKILYERWEQEKRKLPREDLMAQNKTLLRQDFYPEDLPYPYEIQKKILEEIHQCTWYKMVWGNAYSG